MMKMRCLVFFLLTLLAINTGIVYAQNLDINDQSGQVNDTVSFTVSINNASNSIESMQFDISYDSSVLDYTDNFTKGSLVSGFTYFDVRETSTGQIRIAGITTSALSSGVSGEVVKLAFTVKSCSEATLTPINLEDDLSGWSTGDGQFTCTATSTTPTPTATATPTASPVVNTAVVTIKPKIINRRSKGKFKAFITLPSPYSVNNIDVNTVKCEGAPASDGKVDKNRFIATFNVQDLDLNSYTTVYKVSGGRKTKVKFTVSGELKDGTKFEGSDTVKIKGKKR